MLSEQQQLHKFKEYRISVKEFGNYWVLQGKIFFWHKTGKFEYSFQGKTIQGTGINKSISILRPTRGPVRVD